MVVFGASLGASPVLFAPLLAGVGSEATARLLIGEGAGAVGRVADFSEPAWHLLAGSPAQVVPAVQEIWDQGDLDGMAGTLLSAAGVPVPALVEAAPGAPFDLAAAEQRFLIQLRRALWTPPSPQAAHWKNGGQWKLELLSARALQGELPAATVADSLWMHLVLDLMRMVPGAEISWGDPSSLVAQPPRRQADADPHFVDRVLERLRARNLMGIEEQVLVVRFDRRALGRITPLNIDYFLERIQAFLDWRVLLIRREDKHTVTFRLPSLSFLAAAFQEFFSDESFGYYPVLGEGNPDEMNAAMRQGKRLVGLPLFPLPFGDLPLMKGRVHPAVFAIHDLYHAAFFASLPTDVRQVVVELYDGIRALMKEGYVMPFSTAALKYLLDVEFAVRTLDGLFGYLDLGIQRRLSGMLRPTAEEFINEPARRDYHAWVSHLLVKVGRHLDVEVAVRLADFFLRVEAEAVAG